MDSDILQRKKTHFVLWRPGSIAPPPQLVIGTYAAVNSPVLNGEQRFAMSASATTSDLYEVAANACNLVDGTIYHYWFEVRDTDVYLNSTIPLRITDPTAYSVDWRLTFVLPAPYNPDPNTPTENEMPAAVIAYRDGLLQPADPEVIPDSFETTPDVPMAGLPSNNQLVIYELPTTWTKTGDLLDAKHVGVGTFRDVLALVDKNEPSAHFGDSLSDQYLVDLGINALELLPPADSYLDRRSWGYGTSNYFSPDFDLGRPLDATATAAMNVAQAPTAVRDFLQLIRACHRSGIRFFYDAVMAFSKQDAYRFINFTDYHVNWNSDDPEKAGRDGFGGDLWKYAWNPVSYDPVAGNIGPAYLARRHMLTHLLHWMNFYHLDGLRLDSIVNYNSWDFVGDIRDVTRSAWRDRWANEGNPSYGEDSRFLVVGEELSVPKALLDRLDGLWNEDFKRIIRQVILGRNSAEDPSFEWSVRKLIDCRNLGFADGSQAVNYLGSHDVGGFGNERFYNYLDHNGVVYKEKQIKLAFVCLLTAVGIPMLLAGDEFAEQSNFAQTTDANKEIDAINYEHAQDPWRGDVLTYVSRLVKFRTLSTALCVNDTEFIHVDFEEGKRVLAWKRGAGTDVIVVVANFSDWGTADPLHPSARYDVPNWPAIPDGKQWREVSQDYDVVPGRAGNEPLFPWEAKVYAIR